MTMWRCLIHGPLSLTTAAMCVCATLRVRGSGFPTSFPYSDAVVHEDGNLRVIDDDMMPSHGLSIEVTDRMAAQALDYDLNHGDDLILEENDVHHGEDNDGSACLIGNTCVRDEDDLVLEDNGDPILPSKAPLTLLAPLPPSVGFIFSGTDDFEEYKSRFFAYLTHMFVSRGCPDQIPSVDDDALVAAHGASIPFTELAHTLQSSSGITVSSAVKSTQSAQPFTRQGA